MQAFWGWRSIAHFVPNLLVETRKAAHLQNKMIFFRTLNLKFWECWNKSYQTKSASQFRMLWHLQQSMLRKNLTSSESYKQVSFGSKKEPWSQLVVISSCFVYICAALFVMRLRAIISRTVLKANDGRLVSDSLKVWAYRSERFPGFVKKSWALSLKSDWAHCSTN